MTYLYISSKHHINVENGDIEIMLT